MLVLPDLTVCQMETVLRLVMLVITAHLVLEPLLSTLANQATTMIRLEAHSSKAVCAVDLTSIVQAGETPHQHLARLELT